jgi:predicted nuclease of restriction endonuclease-like (RecB) superfamily
MRQFYQKFSSLRRELIVDDDSGILSALRRELSWTHYKALLRVEKPDACIWYMNEAAEQNWSVRALERQINSLYYERLLLSKEKKTVLQEAKEHTAQFQQEPAAFMRDPYVLEFLNIKDRSHFRESELEQAIIAKIQDFLLELGRGFAFVARQKRISTETKEFYIDLVFYNYHLKCFILIDLKTGELTHQDVGQMDMYVRMFDDLQKGDDNNPTVGLILCTEKDKAIVKYSVLHENKQLFASKYMLYLPTEEVLIQELQRETQSLKEDTMGKEGNE